MQVQQIIQASAKVVTITHLAPGNVYKRVETTYDGTATLRFGVVQDVMNNGEDAAVTALEYKPEYGGISVELKVYEGSKPVAIFAATPEEVRTHLAELQKAAQDRVNRVQKELDMAREAAVMVDRVAVQAAEAGALSAPEVAPAIQA